MFKYTIISNTEFKIENKNKNFLLFYIGDETLAINEIKRLNLEELVENKVAKIKELQDKFQADYDTYLASYPQAEVASFNDKQREAVAYNLDNTTPTPIIDSILARLGEDKATYIKSILDKVKFLAEREGEMVKTRDAIKACTTQADLDAIVV